MNNVCKVVWSHTRQQFVVVSEIVSSVGKTKSSAALAPAVTLALACALSPAAFAQTASVLPTGGSIVGGTGSISQSGNTLTVTQTSAKLATNWQSFSIGAGNTVNFVQPSSSSVALNRVLGNDVSVIQGAINANGQVFLINPNGVLFTPTSQVNVGGLVATTLNLSTDNFMAGNYKFEGASSNAIINQGNITASGDNGKGGTIALIAAKITNDGSLNANAGNVLLGAGSAVTLDLGGPVKLQVTQGAIDALINQGGAIKADGGLVYLTAKAAGDLASTVINHTGITEAQTLATGEKGQIYLMGDMAHGQINVGGKLDASAPHGGDGGFVETSAAKVAFANDVKVTTAAANGKTGTWLIDPTDFTIANSGGDMTATQLSTNLGSSSVTIQSANGDIFVNDNITWSSGNTLTLSAYRNININATIDASGGSGGVVKLYYAQGGGAGDYNFGLSSTGFAGKINLQAGSNFYTKEGSGGNDTAWTVITRLGTDTDATTTPSSNSLQGLAYDNFSTGGIYANLSGKFVLGADIDASATSLYWDSGRGFIPIGGLSTGPFTGRFDGLGHRVTDLTINRTADYQGLFAKVQGSGTVRNLELVDPNIMGNSNIGAVAGLLQNGTISNVAASGTAAYIDGTLNVGGLVGRNFDGTISYSHSTATVTGGSAVGGLVGLNSGFGGSVIEYSYSTGRVGDATFYPNAHDVGGLVGVSDEIIKSSYATGSVVGGYHLGGLVGMTDSSSASITNSYATGAVTSTSTSTSTSLSVGGLVGTTESRTAISKSYAIGRINVVAGAQGVGGLVGTDNSGGPSTANASYWDTQTSGLSTSALGSGKTTSELSSTNGSIAPYGEWGVVTDSNLSSSYVYPVLTMTGGSPIWKIYTAGGGSSGGSSGGGSSGGSSSGGSSSGGSSSGSGSSGGNSPTISAPEQAAKNAAQGEAGNTSKNVSGNSAHGRHDPIAPQPQPQSSSGTVLSGGLALMDSSAVESSSSGSTAADDKDANERKKSGSDATAQNNSAGRDASGFMRVFVVSGGIKLPQGGR